MKQQVKKCDAIWSEMLPNDFEVSDLVTEPYLEKFTSEPELKRVCFNVLMNWYLLLLNDFLKCYWFDSPARFRIKALESNV